MNIFQTNEKKNLHAVDVGVATANSTEFAVDFADAAIGVECFDCRLTAEARNSCEKFGNKFQVIKCSNAKLR